MGLSLKDFKAAVEVAGFVSISVGYTGMPAYKHPVISGRRAHAFKCADNAGHSGRYEDGTCPVAERVIPRIILGYLVETQEAARREAEVLHSLIARLEKG
jgi:hypothetical protein